MSSSKSPNLETPHQLQIPRSSRDRGQHTPVALVSHSRAGRGCSVSPGRWVCTAALRGETKCQQPPVPGALEPLPPITESTGARRGAQMPRSSI